MRAKLDLKKLVFNVRPEFSVIVKQHRPECKHPKTEREKDCDCPKSFYIAPGRLRAPAGTESWEMARTRAKEWMKYHDPETARARKLQEAAERARPGVIAIPLSDAFLKFIDSKRSGEGIRDLVKYESLHRKLKAFAEEKNVATPNDVTVDFLDEFQKTWETSMPLGPDGKQKQMSGFTKEKRKGFLIAFFDFCIARNWIESTQQFLPVRTRRGEKLVSKDNPARFLKVRGKSRKPRERRPLTPRLYKAILAAWGHLGASIKTPNQKSVAGFGQRMKIGCELMYRTGFALTDAFTARRDRLKKVLHHFFFDVNRQKTGNPVYVEISPKFAKELMDVPTTNTHKDYFFWAGSGEVTNAADTWQKSFVRLREFLDEKMVREDMGVDEYDQPNWPTFHNFRYSFVENLFLKGADVPEVATLIGDTPDVVRKHYYKFSTRLQEKANQANRRTWSNEDLESLQQSEKDVAELDRMLALEKESA